jgi:hypothetical protein
VNALFNWANNRISAEVDIAINIHARLIKSSFYQKAVDQIMKLQAAKRG